MSGSEDHHSLRARATDLAVKLRNVIRRVTISKTDKLIWQALGYGPLPDGTRETFQDVETFGVAGFQSRPDAGTTEAIIAHVGASDDHRVMIATKNRGLEPALADGETSMVNAKTEVRLTALGLVALGGDATVTLNPLNGVATGLTFDSWGQPIKPVSVTVFAKP